MQPIRLTILGDFWDSYLYRGRLYLWGMEGEVAIYNWNGAIGSLSDDSYNMLPLTCAFLSSDILYDKASVSLVLKDPEVKAVVTKKFLDVSERDWHLSTEVLRPFTLGVQDTPFKALHDDFAFYNSRIYALTHEGLFSVITHRSSSQKSPISTRVKKHWDGGGYCVKSGSGRLAIAAGDDGLFEFNCWTPDEPVSIADRYTLFADWSFASIYASSDRFPGYLVGFKWDTHNSDLLDETRSFYWGAASDRSVDRQFQRIYEEEEIFNLNHINRRSAKLTWGSQEKLYRLFEGSLEAVRFTQKNLYGSDDKMPLDLTDRPPSAFDELGELEFAKGLASNSSPLVASTACFGTIVEFDKGLAVLMSDGEYFEVKGPIVRWRIFPRSNLYENQLHVVLDDRLEIYSFNQDYFVDQQGKQFGIEFRRNRWF